MVGRGSDGVSAKVLFVRGLQKEKGGKKRKRGRKEARTETKENGKGLETSEKARTAAE